MAQLRFSNLSKDLMANFFKALIDQDKKPGRLRIYEGEMPNSPDTNVSIDSMLGEVDFTYPSAQNAVQGTVVFTFVENALAIKDGTATWARIISNSGKVVLDCDISSEEETNPNKRGIIILNSTEIKKGGPLLISKMIFTVGATK